MIKLNVHKHLCSPCHWCKNILVAVVVTICSFAFSDYINNFLLGETAFSKSFKSPDYILLDFYESVESQNTIGYLSPNIIIVDDEKCNRQQMALLIKAIDGLSPAVIGIDHTFNEDQEYDSLLIHSINSCKSPIVLAAELKFDTEFQRFESTFSNKFISDFQSATWGVTNLDEPSVSPHHIIRKVCRSYQLSNGKSINSFPFEIISHSGILSPEKLNQIPSSTYINFRQLVTPRLDWKSFITSEDGDSVNINVTADDICGKIVLIGITNARSDLHIIPSEKCFSGVEIHAAALHTYANSQYIRESKKWCNYVIAILCVFFFSLLLYYASNSWNHIGNLCVRIVQAIMIIVFVVIGYVFYKNETDPMYVDFSLSILMIGVSSFVFDVVRGFYGVYLLIKNKIL